MMKDDEILNPNSCFSKAKRSELLFILLERDPAAPNAIRYWANERIHLGLNTREDPKIVEALAIADTMEKHFFKVESASQSDPSKP